MEYFFWYHEDACYFPYKTLHNLYISVTWFRGWRMHKNKLVVRERISGVIFLWRNEKGVIKYDCVGRKYFFHVLTEINTSTAVNYIVY
jgi:hypothetical protein